MNLKPTFLLLIAIFLLSCGKDKTNTPDPDTGPKKYNVSFSIKINGKNDEPKNTIDRLMYLVYDKNDNAVDTLTLSPVPNVATSKLLPGDYTAVFIGSSKIVAHSSTLHSTGLTIGAANSRLEVIYTTVQKFTVVDKDVKMSITVHNIVGQINVTFIDRIPAGVGSIYLYIPNDPERFDVLADKPVANSQFNRIGNSVKLDGSSVGIQNTGLAACFFNSTLPATFRVVAYDNNGVSLNDKVSPKSFICKRGTGLSFSGRLFLGDGLFTL